MGSKKRRKATDQRTTVGRMLPRADTKRKRMVGKTGGTRKGGLTKAQQYRGGNPWGPYMGTRGFVRRVNEDLFMCGCIDVKFQIGREPTKHGRRRATRIDGIVATRRGVRGNVATGTTLRDEQLAA